MAKNNTTDLGSHIYAGSVRGAIAYVECMKSKKPYYELTELDGEITALEWGQSNDEILIGNKNGIVKIYNTGLNKYLQHITADEIGGNGAVIGLGLENNQIIIGRTDGSINLYNNNNKKNEVVRLNLLNEAIINVMIYNDNRQIIATGGENYDLKLWDINSKKDVFKAKSLGKDELELPIPTSIHGISFLNEDNVVACITKEGMVLLYDERAQRRPVKQYHEKKASFTAIKSYKDRQVFVGTTKGYLQLIDMRQGKCLKTFQPYAGAVTSINCYENDPYVVTTSLDKHLRIHHIDTKEVVHKKYMKIGLTKLLMRPVVKEEPKMEEVVQHDNEYEDLFDNMETINDDSDEAANNNEEEQQKLTKRKRKSKIKSPKKLKAA